MMGTRKGLAGALLIGALGIMALMLPGIAAAKDRNHDQIPDRWENRHHLSLSVNQAHRDQDHDGLNNRQEFRAGDNPRDRDSDNDGTGDGQEDAGTVASFDGTTLTVNLFNGSSVSGMVTENTDIKCEGQNRGPGNGDDDNSGPGNGHDNGGGDDKAMAKDHGGDDDPGDDNDENENCSTADLVPGAVVHEAELELSNGDAAFEEVELSATGSSNDD